MKQSILILAFLICNISLAASQTLDWESQVFSSQLGSCETHDLNFKALRFTKIALKSETGNLFLRVILFIRPDNTQAVRLTTQELLGCQTSQSGSEICSYRPLSNQWIESRWLKDQSTGTLDVGGVGLLSYDVDTSEISIRFKEDFSFPEVVGPSFPGSMILVNFNDQGINVQKLCPAY